MQHQYLDIKSEITKTAGTKMQPQNNEQETGNLYILWFSCKVLLFVFHFLLFRIQKTPCFDYVLQTTVQPLPPFRGSLSFSSTGVAFGIDHFFLLPLRTTDNLQLPKWESKTAAFLSVDCTHIATQMIICLHYDI